MKAAVVGANRGIGLEITKKLVEDGHDVFAFCRSSSPELDKINTKKVIQNFEVTDLKKMETQLKENSTDTYDCLFHVSGVLESESLDDFNEETIVKQFKVNSLGPILTCKAFKPHLNKEAKIGLLTSRMGSIEDNGSGGMYGYRMSKSALNSAGKSLSVDLKDQGITVLLLHPGFVKTDMTNHNGNITPEESAKGLIEVLQSKTIKDTGTFWHMNGEPLPW